MKKEAQVTLIIGGCIIGYAISSFVGDLIFHLPCLLP